jgi:hypothetical protein
VSFTGEVATVASNPLGFDSTARLENVTGSFTYDLRLADQLPTQPQRGRYWSGLVRTAFTFTVKGKTVTGSGYAILEVENLDSSETFRFLDGPQGDGFPRIMKVDGVDAPTLKLFLAISNGLAADAKWNFTSDALPDPFPPIDITKFPHTFSLSDAGGTLLMQLDALTPS